MFEYRVKVLEQATDDVDEISKYISLVLKNKIASEKIINGIYDVIDSLENFPMRNAIIDCDMGRKFSLRAELVGNFNIIYSIERETVIVYKVVYAKSDFISKLREDDFNINQIIMSEPNNI